MVLNEGGIFFNGSKEAFKSLDELPEGIDFPEGWKLERIMNR